MNIINELERFLSQNTNNGALLITGKWGCGKTYILREIAKEYNGQKEYLIVITSLFGIDTVNNLHQVVKEHIAFSQGFSDKSDTAKNWFGKIKKRSSPIASALSESSQIAKGFNAILNINWSDFISVEKNISCFVNGQKRQKQLVLIFDDFERSKIDIVDLMGAINDYSENKDIKVVIVANEDEIENENYNDIKEKLISRTIHMSLDDKYIVKNIISSYTETAKGYKEFLLENTSVIHKVFVDSQSENIRSLKSVLMDFERVYDIWKNSKIPMNGNIERVLYQFGAVEFEYKAGNYINASISYIVYVAGDTAKSEKKKEIESKYIPDTFNGFLTSLSMWIVDGEWNDTYFVDEIKKRYVKEDIPPEQRFINWQFWDMQQEDIDIGMPLALQKAYDGQASQDELIALMQKVHAMKSHGISLPCEVDYKKIDIGFEKRKNEIKKGLISEPKRRIFSEKEQLDSEAVELYKKIELMNNQLHAWNNRRLFITYLNDKNISHYDLKNKILESFDEELLDLFFEKYNKVQNGEKRELHWTLDGFCFDDQNYSTKCDIAMTVQNLKTLVEKIKAAITTGGDKMSNAISKAFIKLLNDKIEQISRSFQA